MGRHLYAKIAIGQAALPVEFYSHLHQKEEDAYVTTLGMQPKWSRTSERFLDLGPQQTEHADQEVIIGCDIASPESDHESADPQQHQGQVISISFSN